MPRARLSPRNFPIPGQFLALPHSIFNTPEFSALSPRAVKLLMAMGLQHNGRNNGALTMLASRMKRSGFTSSDQLYKARDELLAGGWIQMTRQGGKHLASLYAVTWVPIDRSLTGLDVRGGPLASNLWKSENAAFRETRGAERSPPRGAL